MGLFDKLMRLFGKSGSGLTVHIGGGDLSASHHQPSDKELAEWLQAYDLSQWWATAFTDAERKRIAEHLSASNQPVQALSMAAGWFLGPADRSIAQRLLDRGEILSTAGHGDVLDRHFLAGAAIKAYYRDRDKVPDAYEKAVRACMTQVEIAPQAVTAFRSQFGTVPSHPGFEQLAILAEKAKHYEKAISLCEQAKAQGWQGDWDHRLKRLKRKV